MLIGAEKVIDEVGMRPFTPSGSQFAIDLLAMFNIDATRVSEFTLRMAVGEAATIACTFYADDPGDEQVTKRYVFMPVEVVEVGATEGVERDG